MAENYPSVVERVLDAGKYSIDGKYLEFLDGELHQYVVAKPADDYEHITLAFIEEHWGKSGEKDVIDQWIVQVGPTMQAHHVLLLERSDSVVIEIWQLGTEGAEDVVRRIAEKATRVRAPQHP
jgi:hypothetical protein